MAQNDILHIGDSQNKFWRENDLTLSLDGVNDSIQGLPIDWRTTLLPINGTWTVSVWVKPISFLGGGFAEHIFYQRYTSGENSLQCFFGVNYIGFQYANATSGLATRKFVFTDIRLNKWHHLVYVRDNSLAPANRFTFYHNGIKKDTSFVQSENYVLTGVRNGIDLIGTNFSNTTVFYQNMQICNLMVSTLPANSEEVIQMFYAGNDFSQYPTTMLSNRYQHLGGSRLSEFDTFGGQARMLDISGNNNNAFIDGQGAVATTVNFNL